MDREWCRAFVWFLVSYVPVGFVTTYGNLAKVLGVHPRSVAAALRANHTSSIPCHRVVAADGSVGGYNKGREEKIRRLRLEGVPFHKGRVDIHRMLTV